MNKEDKRKLSEFVFKDFSEDERFEKLKVKWDIDKTASADPEKAIDIYYRKTKNTPDAERWEYALDSYKLYECFKDDSYKKEKGFLFYNGIKITADVLTGPKEIKSRADQFEYYEPESLKLFYSVAYTAGNLCPVMKNPGGRKGKTGGVDTCWYKLDRFLDSNASIKSINKAFPDDQGKDNNNLSRRTADTMFCLFPNELDRDGVIENLMLNDYKSPLDMGSFNSGTAFLDHCSWLIVKRGIKIYCNSNNPDKNLDYGELANGLINEKKKAFQTIINSRGEDNESIDHT